MEAGFEIVGMEGFVERMSVCRRGLPPIIPPLSGYELVSNKQESHAPIPQNPPTIIHPRPNYADSASSRPAKAHICGKQVGEVDSNCLLPYDLPSF